MPATPSPSPTAAPGLLAADPASARTLALLVVGLLTAWRLATLAAGWVPLYADEMQYWTWSRDLAVGYDTKPPMIAWLIRLTTAVAGDGSFGIRLSTPLVHATTALVLFWVGRTLVSPRVGALSAICYVALPGISVSALVVSVDPALLMFWAFGLAAVIKAEGGGRPTAHPVLWWALAGAFTGCALLTKYAAVAFPVSLLLYLLLARRLRVFASAGPYAYAAALLAVFSPNLVWNFATGFVAVDHVIQDGEYDTASLFNPGEMLEFLGGQFGVFGPVTFGALLYAIARWQRSCQVPGVRLLLCFAVPLLGFMTVQGLLSQAKMQGGGNGRLETPVRILLKVLLLSLHEEPQAGPDAPGVAHRASQGDVQKVGAGLSTGLVLQQKGRFIDVVDGEVQVAIPVEVAVSGSIGKGRRQRAAGSERQVALIAEAVIREMYPLLFPDLLHYILIGFFLGLEHA